MKKITLLLCAILSLNIAVAQNTVTGTIKDSHNEPLPGANIVEKGTNNGTSSDFDGKFTLTVKDGAVLVVSFAGYETQEVAVNGKRTLEIVMIEG
ncbi:MAG: carboxypeptidase-like regulatory domain-containing protein, partial [Flavobacteriaceae bacterium]|nr:carboxypeptidase-like regulatory domain-containing protein [Flavobacteriaceae bacterium]